MIANSTQSIARQVAGPVQKLDSMLVPLSHGFRDSNGIQVGDDAEIRARLVVALEGAREAIVWAQWTLKEGT